MTLLRLPPAPMLAPDLIVDPAAIGACGAALLASSSVIDDLGSFAAGAARLDDWTGVGADRYHSQVQVMRHGADSMSLALRGVARRVNEHADLLVCLRDTHLDLAHRQVGLTAACAQLRVEAELATPTQLDALQARADGVARAVAAYEVDRTAWIGALVAEEQAMIAAFERVLTLAAVEERYGDVPDPADQLLASIPPPGSNPDNVHDWWLTLTRDQQWALVAAAPEDLGNLNGLPAWARDEANTVRLDRDLVRLGSLAAQGVITARERRLLRLAEAADDARTRVGARTDPVTGEQLPVQVYTYDPEAFGSDGAVVLAIGDLDTADNIAIVVPGLGTDGTDIAGLADHGADVYDAARSGQPGESAAVVAWIGYDAPDDLGFFGGPDNDALGVVGEGAATEGGDRLADDVAGLRAGRDGPPAHLTVIGHSYGSTTVGHAAHDHDLAVDDVVLVGSPGAGGDTHHAADLGVGPEHVFVGADDHDPIAALGDDGWIGLGVLGGLGLGDDPAEDDFGAIRFQAEAASGGPHEGGPAAVTAHSSYFDPGSESVTNIGHIVAGDYDQVTLEDPVHDHWWD